MNNPSTNPIVFLDNIGRIIIGTLVAENSNVIEIENPALVHIQPQPNTNQLQLQLLPLFFKEFQADKSASTVWSFNRSHITLSNPIEFTPQFVAQYNQTFGKAVVNPAMNEAKTEVVKLFDDENEDAGKAKSKK